MEYEKQLIWIIPNNEYSENNLEDGRGTFFPFMTGDRDHRSRCQEFCEEHKLSNYPVGGSHDDWGKYLTERGFIVFFNSGVTIDNKYFGALYLPAQLTEKQINFLEDRKELLVTYQPMLPCKDKLVSFIGRYPQLFLMASTVMKPLLPGLRYVYLKIKDRKSSLL